MRSVSWNYLGYFVEFVSGLFLLAYVVRRIPVHNYGIYLLAQSIAASLYLLEFGMGNVLVPMYVSRSARNGLAEISRLASTVSMALLMLGAAGASIMALAAWFVPTLIRLTPTNTALAVRVLILMAFAVALALPQMAVEQLCQAFHRFDRINQLQIAMVAVRVVLTAAVLMAGRGIVALAVVQLIVSVLRLIILWFVARSAIGGIPLRFRFDRGLLLEAMHMSKWAFGDDLSHRISMNTESVVLAAFSSFGQVALFGVGSRLPAHLYQFAARGMSVLIPTLSRHHAEQDTQSLRSTFSSVLRVCLTGLAPLAAFAAICATSLMTVWAGEPYRGAAPVLAWLLLSSLSMVFALPSDIVLYSHGQIPKATRFSIVQTLGKIGLALALARPYGAVGVAAGVAIWHWCVNLMLYLPAACRVAEMKPGELWRAALAEYGPADHQGKAGGAAGANLIQGGTFLGCAAALFLATKLLGTLQVFLACIVVSSLYIAIWTACTALPMWRRAKSEAAAAL